jgi:hypothetical protein
MKMPIDEIIRRLEQFRGGETEQRWVMIAPPFAFENEYIRVLRLDSSNQSGGTGIESGKRWGIIIKIKRDFRFLPNWRALTERLGDNNIRVTPRRGYPGQYGIRLYHMSRNMNTEIIEELLTFIFE